MTSSSTPDDVVVKYATEDEGSCEVCCRQVPTIGRIDTNYTDHDEATDRWIRHSEAVCADCVPLLFACDWAGLEQLVFEYQGSQWTWWEAIVHRRRARRVARRITAINRELFGYLATGKTVKDRFIETSTAPGTQEDR
jgi:hypothetical protein